MNRGILSASAAALAIACGLAVGSSAFAQSGEGRAEAQSPQVADDTQLDREIVVTGSRLVQSGFNTPTPVTVVGAAQIEQRAPANIADVVNEQPAFRVSRSDTVRAGTQLPSGVQNTLDLRGLGDQRTLTLINGHRVVATNYTGTVDTNIIPVGLIERVEVVTGGASAAYGSDAVAGVANFILRNKLTGINGTLQSGITDAGDGFQISGNLAGGFGFAENRGHVIAGFDYNKSNTIGTVYTRPWGKSEIGTITPTAAQMAALGLPASVIATGVEPGTSAPGGLYQQSPTTAYTFDANGNPVLFQQGTLFGQSMTGSTANYGHNLNNVGNPLRTPTSRAVFYGRANYDFNDNITAYVEGNFAHNKTYPFVNNEFISASGAQPALNIQRNNPYVTPAILALIPATATSFNIGRINTEFGGATLYQDSDVWRVLAGLQGNVFGDWKWDASYQYGKTVEHFYNQGLVAAALQKAVNGCTNGNLTAAQLATIATYEQMTGKTCQGFNPFGVGRNPASAMNYFLNYQRQIDRAELEVGAVSLAGSPFSLPAGKLSIATGIERRREYMQADSDPLTSIGTIYSQGNFTPFSGQQHVTEGFLEVGAPILKNAPFAKSLDLNGAVRRTSYQLSGNVTTWKVGGTWEPIPALRLRVTRSRDIRAPSVRELFLTGGFFANTAINDAPNGAVGANGTINVNPLGRTNTVSQAIVSAGSGNPALKPEIADTLTLGGVLTLGRFHASVDYYHIKVAGAIAGLTVQQTIDQCRDGVTAQCQNITFDSTATGGIASVVTRSTNLQTLTVAGYDFEIAYQQPMPLGLGGNLTFRTLLNYAPTNQTYSPLTGVITENANTLGAQAAFSYNVNFGYEKDRVHFDLQLRGFGSRRANPVLYNSPATILGPEDAGYSATSIYSTNKNHYPGVIYVNPSLEFKVNENATFFVNVDNLLNQGPPALTLNTAYDLVGRRYRMGIRAKIR